MPLYNSFSGSFGPLGRASRRYNIATGGTESTFTKNTTQTWKRHIFSTAGTSTLNVAEANEPFTVTVIGGGAGGGGNPDGFGRGPTGGNGGYYSSDVMLTKGAQTVTVGAGGAAGAANIIGGGQGWPGGNGGVSTIASQTTVAGGGQAGTPFAAAYTPATAPAGTPAPTANGGVQAIDYANHGLPSTVGTGGWGGAYNAGGPNPGVAGAVVVEYRIL